MPNNSPAGIQRRFTSAELPRENISTLTPDKLLHLESRIDWQRFFFFFHANNRQPRNYRFNFIRKKIKEQALIIRAGNLAKKLYYLSSSS